MSGRAKTDGAPKPSYGHGSSILELMSDDRAMRAEGSQCLSMLHAITNACCLK